MPPKVLPPLGEAALEQVLHYGNGDHLNFRCPKNLAVALRTQALIHKLELSSVVRVLLAEALENRGIDWRIP